MNLRPPSPEPQERNVTYLLLGVGAISVVNLCALVAASWLLANHPLVLLSLDARNRYLLVTAPLVDDEVLFVLVASARRIVSDPIYFALGRKLDELVDDWTTTGLKVLDTGRRSFRWLERVFERASWPLVFLTPGLVVCVLAGASRMRVRVFALLNIVGTVVVITVTRRLALRAEDDLLRVGEWNERNQAATTIFVLIAVVTGLVVTHRQRSRERKSRDPT